MRKGKDPDPYLWQLDPDPEGPKTSQHCLKHLSQVGAIESTDNDQLDSTGVVYLGVLSDEGGVDAGFLQEVPD